VFIGTKSTPREVCVTAVAASSKYVRTDGSSSFSRPNHAIALSRSELGIASRRAWLPSASQVKRLGASPIFAATRSSARRVSASATTEKTDMTSSAVMPPRCRLITVGRNFDAAATSSSTVLAPPMAWRRWNDDFVSIAMRSWSSTMPRTVRMPK